jgi:glutaredoxin
MSDDFVVYSKTECKYCDLAKQLLLDEGFSYEIVICDNWLADDREEFLKRMEAKIGREYKTFPMIFYKDRFVGGYTELVKKVEEMSCFR